MYKTIPFLLVALSSHQIDSRDQSKQCQKMVTIDFSTKDAFLQQPIFISFLPKTPENQLLDSVCLTFFPLPDDPHHNHIYISRVFCDGSTDITSMIETQVGFGTSRKANPYMTVTDHHIGYAGCDTNILYRCSDFGEPFDPFVMGITFTCRPIGLSCLRKVEEIIRDHCLDVEDYFVLPMKLPNRCVTQQLCTQPPNPFFNTLPYSTVTIH